MTIPEDSSLLSSDPSAPPTRIPPTPLIAPMPSATEPPMQIPASIIVIAILFFVGALVEFTGLFGSPFGSPTYNLVTRLDSLVFLLANILTGIGLLQRRAVARIGAMINILVRYLSMMLLMCWEVTTHQAVSISPSMTMYVSIGIMAVTAVYFAALLFFLNRQAVKAACVR